MFCGQLHDPFIYFILRKWSTTDGHFICFLLSLRWHAVHIRPCRIHARRLRDNGVPRTYIYATFSWAKPCIPVTKNIESVSSCALDRSCERRSPGAAMNEGINDHHSVDTDEIVLIPKMAHHYAHLSDFLSKLHNHHESTLFLTPL